VSQPHVNAADLTTPGGVCAVPNLCRAMDDARVRARTTVAEVFGPMSATDLTRYVETTCLLAGKNAEVAQITMTALSEASRAQDLADNGEKELSFREGATRSGTC